MLLTHVTRVNTYTHAGIIRIRAGITQLCVTPVKRNKSSSSFSLSLSYIPLLSCFPFFFFFSFSQAASGRRCRRSPATPALVLIHLSLISVLSVAPSLPYVTRQGNDSRAGSPAGSPPGGLTRPPARTSYLSARKTHSRVSFLLGISLASTERDL